ncbi:hypothetical protein TWF506_000176 [Arthrobotrys conoides]|uniref:Uncharacterized protein n=1 Tax=Arthrobotrys conoides TaxID=74498 RepID=A0AAN8NZI4_9PEZI
MGCPIFELLVPQDGKWAGYIPTLFVCLGIGAVSMNYLRDYFEFVLATEVLDIQLEPILGHTAWHNNPDFAEVRVPLEAERVGVRGMPGMCYDGKVEMWWDGRKGVGLVRL